MSFEITFLLIAGAITWLWLDSLKAREAAIAAAREACAVEGLMLLDDTVAIAVVKLARDHDGHVKLQRAYQFEFSDTGDNRRQGSVVLLGRRVVLFNVGPRGASLPTTLH